MTLFWIYSGGLVLVTAFFIVYPVYKLSVQTRNDQSFPDLRSDDERQRQNVIIFRERLAELEAEQQLGKLETETFEALKAELEASLLSDVSPAGAGTSETEPHNEMPDQAIGNRTLVFSVVLSVLVAVASYAAYFSWGAYDKVLLAQSASQGAAQSAEINAAAKGGDVNALLDQLYARLTEAPDNLEGWMLFSRSAMKLGQYDRAIEGFGVMIRLFEEQQQNSAPIYGLLAQAHYFKAEGRLTPEVQTALDNALKNDPEEVNALMLMAMHAFDRENYTEAVGYWQRILAVAPDHPAKQSIEEGVMRAQQLLGVDTRPENAKAPDDADMMARITVTVSLDPELASLVAPDDTVFIFAQAESGSRMPLAASRHVVSELPVTVQLNDASAMGPMARLSQVETANIIARVSKSGLATVSPGDLEGRQNKVAVFSGESVEVLIQNRL